MYSFPSEEAWLAWKRKRRNTLIGFIMVGAVVGIDTSVVYSTLLLFLRDIIKSEKPYLWFGLIIATFYTSSAIFAGVTGRWLDKTRRVRMYVNVNLLAQAIGFLIYAIPFHPLNLLLGRAICGAGEPFIAVVSGELFRIYDVEGGNRAIFWLANSISLGFVMGPALNTLFANLDFHIGWMRFNRLNFTSICIALCILVVMVISNILISNCSAEFDLKEYLREHEEIAEEGGDNRVHVAENGNDGYTPTYYI